MESQRKIRKYDSCHLFLPKFQLGSSQEGLWTCSYTSEPIRTVGFTVEKVAEEKIYFLTKKKRERDFQNLCSKQRVWGREWRIHWSEIQPLWSLSLWQLCVSVCMYVGECGGVCIRRLEVSVGRVLLALSKVIFNILCRGWGNFCFIVGWSACFHNCEIPAACYSGPIHMTMPHWHDLWGFLLPSAPNPNYPVSNSTVFTVTSIKKKNKT